MLLFSPKSYIQKTSNIDPGHHPIAQYSSNVWILLHHTNNSKHKKSYPKKKDPTLMKNQYKEDKTGKVASPKPGECKKKRKVENSTLPAFAKSKVGSSCGTTGLEATTVWSLESKKEQNVSRTRTAVHSSSPCVILERKKGRKKT